MEQLTSNILMIEPVIVTAALLWREIPFIYKMQFSIAVKNLNYNGYYAARSRIFLWSSFSSRYINFFVTSGHVMQENEALFEGHMPEIFLHDPFLRCLNLAYINFYFLLLRGKRCFTLMSFLKHMRGYVLMSFLKLTLL